jgi:rhodanese-related sulfurtransferase
MTTSLRPEALAQVLRDGGEYALLDVRERGAYARGHLLLAINLPLGGLELHMRRRVPRLTTRVVLCDEEDGYAARAAAVMQSAGYSHVSIVEGGVAACRAAGFELFRGHYVVPYAFGLYVDRRCGPPAITAQELAGRMAAAPVPLVVDSRTLEEYREDSVPGAIGLPLGELPYRIRELLGDDRTPVVVTCGAVTRGVLGGESLIECGIENPVFVLAGGLRRWRYAGFTSEPGVRPRAPEVSDRNLALAAEAVGRVAAAARVRRVTDAELDAWRSDPDRTLFIVDVRTREEFEAGHLHDAVWVPGGELIGLYEDHIGTMNARVCLVDDDGVRAAFVASWLVRMGWPDVAVLDGGIQGRELAAGPSREHLPELEGIDVVRVSPEALLRRLEAGGPLVLDFADSITYMRGHVPGAWWALRSRLPEIVGRLPAADGVVTTCPDGRLAALAAVELTALTDLPVAVLHGGTRSWRLRGFELVAGLTRALCEVEDHAPEFVVRPGDDTATVRAARRRMIEWQDGLLEKLEQDSTFAFPELNAPRHPDHRE